MPKHLLSTLAISTLACAVYTTSFAAPKTYTPSIVNNGVGLIVYSKDGFGHDASDTTEADNLVSYLKTSALKNTNIIYLDGFNITGASQQGAFVPTIPDIATFPNYKYLITQLHNAGKTVILASAITEAGIDFTANDVMQTLGDYVKQMGADGLAFDYEGFKPPEVPYTDYINGLTPLGNTMIANHKYFGFIPPTGNLEKSIAPIFNNLNCQTSSTATNFCFESIMQYDTGDFSDINQVTLYHGIHTLSKLNHVNLYGDYNTNHHPIIRIMVPGSYSGGTYPSVNSDTGKSVTDNDKNYGYQNFICDITQIVHDWKDGNLLTSTELKKLGCPENQTYFINDSTKGSMGLQGILFPSSTGTQFGGVDSYRVVNADYALTPEGFITGNSDTQTLSTFHYLCDPAGSTSFACRTGVPDYNTIEKWVPNANTFNTLMQDNLPSNTPTTNLEVTPHFSTDTQEVFSIAGGLPADNCTLHAPDSVLKTANFNLNNSGEATVSLTFPNATSNIAADGQTSSYYVTCTNSGSTTPKTITRYGDKAKLCFVRQSDNKQTCMDSLFSETAAAAINSSELAAGGYNLSIMPHTLNYTQTQNCTTIDDYPVCDNTLTPYAAQDHQRVSTLSIDGNQNLQIGFYENTNKQGKNNA